MKQQRAVFVVGTKKMATAAEVACLVLPRKEASKAWHEWTVSLTIFFVIWIFFKGVASSNCKHVKSVVVVRITWLCRRWALTSPDTARRSRVLCGRGRACFDARHNLGLGVLHVNRWIRTFWLADRRNDNTLLLLEEEGSKLERHGLCLGSEVWSLCGFQKKKGWRSCCRLWAHLGSRKFRAPRENLHTELLLFLVWMTPWPLSGSPALVVQARLVQPSRGRGIKASQLIVSCSDMKVIMTFWDPFCRHLIV